MSRNKNISIVQWYPKLEKHKCGYCKQTNTNCSYGMWAESLTVLDYQLLIDRGWRRSGKYCYKPVMDVTCCPLYTIRCEALNLKVSKSQKKIIKRVNRYLNDSTEDKEDAHVDDTRMDSMAMSVDHGRTNFHLGRLDSEEINMIISGRNDNALIEDNDTYTPIEQTNVTSTSSVVDKSGDKYKPGLGADPNKPPCKKAKLIRLERKQQKLAAQGLTQIQVQANQQQTTKTLEELIDDVKQTAAHKLKVCLVLTGGKKDWTDIKQQEYEVYKKYQMAIHGDPSDKCSERQFQSFLLESPLQIIVKQMNPLDSSFNESAQLFAKYQMFIHNETESECDVETYKEFLVDSPLKHIILPDGPQSGYGSFHQQYWLDDKLIAVGVIDILPKCVSSVYFFYDPDYRNLTLGTYGSLRELYFVRNLCRNVPTIKYYYLGFYIHSCPKMRYKSKFSPSYLLCPETYVWFPIEHCTLKLDSSKYCRFNDDLDAIDKNACTTPNELDGLMILNGYKGCVPFKFIKDKVKDLDEFIRFGNLIGKKLIPRILMAPHDF